MLNTYVDSPFLNSQQGNGDQFEGTFLVDINRLLSFDNQEGRNVTIERFEHSAGDQLQNRIVNGKMTFLNSSVGSGFVQNFQLDTEGQVTTDAGIVVQITTTSTLSASQTPAESPDAAVPFTGKWSMAADDGGRLVAAGLPGSSVSAKTIGWRTMRQLHQAVVAPALHRHCCHAARRRTGS